MSDLLRHVMESEFPYPGNLVHLFVGGSELHGAKVHGTDDLDIYGVYIEPPEKVLGLESFPHFVWSTAGNDCRNGPDDVDVTLYSLRKWAEMACKGNPTALHFLFTKNAIQNDVWAQVVAHREVFLARSCMKQFIGFADDQLKRMSGGKGRGKKGQRPELEEKFAYDFKAAMHALRLLGECKELIADGQITLPRPEREFLVRVRTGQYSMAEVRSMAQEHFAECEEAVSHSPLPEEIDRTAISQLIIGSYKKAWKMPA
jgi:uncharacterized protein